LLSKKATTKTNSAGETPLFAAVDYGHLDIVKLLLENGADPNGKKPNGEPVLFSAAQKHAEIIAPLVNAGANINATNTVGSTALIMAAYYGNVDSVLALLSLGARVGAKTTEGFTALQVARSLRDREQIIEVLSNPDEALKNPARFKSAKLITPIDAKSIKKSQWKERVRSYWNPSGPIRVATISEFKAAFGEPSKTQSRDGVAYWYYDCSDGTIQIALIDPNMSGGRMLIKEVNEY
jgi:ankyrin repeat protein